MPDLTNEEVVSLARLMRRIDRDSADNGISASDMEDYAKGLARLDNAGFMILKAAANSLEGKPFAVTSDNPETVERCRSLAEHIGVSIDEAALSDGLTRIVFGAPAPLMPESVRRFCLNADGNIADSLNRIPAAPVCNCDECQKRALTDTNEQINLRRWRRASWDSSKKTPGEA